MNVQLKLSHHKIQMQLNEVKDIFEYQGQDLINYQNKDDHQELSDNSNFKQIMFHELHD